MTKKARKLTGVKPAQIDLGPEGLKAQNDALASEVVRLQEVNEQQDATIEALRREVADMRKAMTTGKQPEVKPTLAPLKPFTLDGQEYTWTRRNFRAYGRLFDVTQVQGDEELLRRVIADFPQLVTLKD